MFSTRLSNRTAAELFQASWLGSSCLAAATVAGTIYIAIRPVLPFALSQPTTPWPRVRAIGIWWLCSWLIGNAVYAAITGAWVAYATGAPALIGFLLLGPIAEEMLFRGAIFELSQRSWPTAPLAPIIFSTLLFSLYHLQLHSYRITPFVLLQLAFVLPLGYTLGKIRSLTGSIWPGFVLHVATNLPNAFGSPMGAA